MADNLLDKASILLTPTAYNDGSMLSIKPENGDGDFTFSRNSAATRVNAQGLVENVQILSTELVTNGDFDTGSDWIKGNGTTISGGQANLDGSLSGSFQDPLRQSSVFTVGKTYKVEYTISNYVSGAVTVFGNGATEVSSNGTYTQYINATITTLSFQNRAVPITCSIDNVSVKELVDDTDLPRIDYTDGCGSWLLEPQSTNYSSILHSSEQPSTWHSNAGVTITANAATSPMGLQNSSLVVNNASSGGRYARNLFNFSTGSGLQTVTCSYFVKYYNNQWVRLRSIFFTGSPANDKYTYFDIQNGVVGTSDATHTAKIKYYGNGWYRCSITFEIDKSSDNNGYVHIEAMDGDNSGTYAAIGQGYYAFGSQGEELPFPTSYIPQNGAITTRLADVATNSGNSSLINSTEGVLYFESEVTPFDSGIKGVEISDGSTSNLISLYFLGGASSTSLNARFQVGGTNVFQQQIKANMNYNQNYKIAFKWEQDNFKIYVDGVLEYSLLSGNTFGANTLSNIDFNYVGSSNFNFYGKAKALAVYKEALTDAELQSLTTI